MSTSSIFLVTYNDGDYYTRHAQTLAAFPSLIDAQSFALGHIAAEAEVYGNFIQGVAIVEMNGDETVSTLDIDVTAGIDRSTFADPIIVDRSAFYRSLSRSLSR